VPPGTFNLIYSYYGHARLVISYQQLRSVTGSIAAFFYLTQSTLGVFSCQEMTRHNLRDNNIVFL